MRKTESGMPLTVGDSASTADVCTQEANKAYKRVRYVHYSQIMLLAFAFVTCSAMAYCISQVNYVTSEDACLLFSSWKLRRLKSLNEASIEPPELRLDREKTKWGDPSSCDWTQYGFVGVAITAFLMCWFFALFRPYHEAFVARRSTSATRLVLPTVGVSLCFFVFTLVITIILSNGVSEWCEQLTMALKQQGVHQASCSKSKAIQLEHRHSDNGKEEIDIITRDFLAFAIGAQVFAWLSVVLWLASFLLVVIRFALHLDFPSYYFAWTTLENNGHHVRNLSTDAHNTSSIVCNNNLSEQQQQQHKVTTTAHQRQHRSGTEPEHLQHNNSNEVQIRETSSTPINQSARSTPSRTPSIGTNSGKAKPSSAASPSLANGIVRTVSKLSNSAATPPTVGHVTRASQQFDDMKQLVNDNDDDMEADSLEPDSPAQTGTSTGSTNGDRTETTSTTATATTATVHRSGSKSNKSGSGSGSKTGSGSGPGAADRKSDCSNNSSSLAESLKNGIANEAVSLDTNGATAGNNATSINGHA